MTLTDKSLALMGAPWHIEKLTGQDRADVFAFANAVAAAERERCISAVEAICTTEHESKNHFIVRVGAVLMRLRQESGT